MSELDWTAIELDYRAGVLPVSAVAKKHGVSPSTLTSTAQKFGWERKPLDVFAVNKAHGLASSPSEPKMSMDSDLSAKDVETSAVLAATAVLDIHRKDVRKLREFSTKFSDQFTELFSNLHLVDFEPETPERDKFKLIMRRLTVLIGDKTPADLLEQLSRVMVRLVQIERQTYGLDVLPVNPETPSSGEAVQSQVNDLWKKVQELQKDKTVH